MFTTKKFIETTNNILIILFVIFILSCDNAVDNQNNLDCSNLKTGIININSDIVKSEINKISTDLRPVKTANDNIGHKNNLDLLVQRLNVQCNNINTELLCYACIKTNPPQSELLVITDSSGAIVKRIIDISTPSNTNLSCVRIHEYFNE